ncbi:MAG: hypothetical protein ACK5KN_09385 [Dysgonomonas sp.]|uniref:hypothetical protein n=1 Tax=Dysgonomonas sp. TaxID=1891233 RepID=UPI003A8803CC
MALPKSKQKASAPFDLTPRPLQREREPQPSCRLKGTNGLSPRPFLSRLHRVGTPSMKRGAKAFLVPFAALGKRNTSNL